MSVTQEAAAESANAMGRLSWGAVARRLPIILVLGLGGGALGVLAAANQPAEYGATTTVLVNPLDGNAYSTGTRGQNLANLGTEAEMASSDAVSRLVQLTLRSSEPQADLVARLEVTNPPNSQVLRISFTDSTPARARAGADAFAKGFLTFRERRSEESVQAQIDNLTAAITANESALRRSAAALGKTKGGTPERILAQQKVSAATAELSRLESQVSDLRLFQGDPGNILTPAQLPLSPIGLPTWAIQAGGVALGLLVGIGLAIWLALNDRRLRSPRDIKVIGLPALATIAHAPSGSAAVLSDPGTTLPDGARLLRSAVAMAMPMAGRLLVVPADSTTERSASPLALAAALVRADRRVTVVDATGGKLSSHVTDGPTPGLSDALVGSATAEDVAVEHQPGLRFVTAGTSEDATADKLASPSMNDLVRSLAETTQWLIIVGPRASSPEAQALAALCDGVIVSATLKRSTQTGLRKAVDAITAGGAILVGIALDRTPAPVKADRTKEAVPSPTLDEMMDASGAETEEVEPGSVTSTTTSVSGAR